MNGYVGKCGTAIQISFNRLKIEDPGSEVARVLLGGWLLNIPDVSPLRQHWSLTVHHLREEANLVHKKGTPDASHEFTLWILDEDSPVNPNRPDRMIWLTPPEVWVQVTGLTDEQAVQLIAIVARAVMNRELPVEPKGISGGVELWTESIRNSAAVIRDGKNATLTGQPLAATFTSSGNGGHG
jgi:hypothetical protein